VSRLTLRPASQRQDAFEHAAFLYGDEREYVAGIVPFLREGVAAGEPTLVVVNADRIGQLRASLDGHADGVHFADMAYVGRNPARIIPAWRRFVDEHGKDGRRLRGVGEPIWAGRSPAELTECQRHESLLNLAFAGGQPWGLRGPYDSPALPAAVIDEARRTHPVVVEDGTRRESASYHGLQAVGAATFDGPLPEPPGRPPELIFETGPLDQLRRVVAAKAAAAGFGAAQRADLVLAVNEVAANSLRHGGGKGILRVWQEGGTLICEVRDAGQLDDPLVGREHPGAETDDGRGVWLANHLCDLVQLRSSDAGTVARLHMRRR
jgi:anti-sigma regulatory factor (Ser/Thr protein kinase)